MRFGLFTLFASLGAAAPAGVTTFDSSGDYAWQVTNWHAGCSRYGCSYNFYISGPAGATTPTETEIPSFKRAYCSSFAGEGGDYTPCNVTEPIAAVLKAKLLPRDPDNVDPHIQISYYFTDSETSTSSWNYTGSAVAKYNAFVAPMMNFTVTPDTFTGAA